MPVYACVCIDDLDIHLILYIVYGACVRIHHTLEQPSRSRTTISVLPATANFNPTSALSIFGIITP